MSENDTELNNFIDQFKSECISFQENEMGRGLELSFVQCAYNRLDHSEIGDLNTVFIQGDGLDFIFGITFLLTHIPRDESHIGHLSKSLYLARKSVPNISIPVSYR